MPYHPPSFGGLIREQLVVRSDGRVEIDGEPRGWIDRLTIMGERQFHADPDRPETTLIDFKMAVVPERHMAEPDAVYDLAGRHIGYTDVAGKFTPLEEEPVGEQPASHHG